MPYLHENLSDHPSLVGIIRFPSCTYTTTEIKIPTIIKDGSSWLQYISVEDVATEINGLDVESTEYVVKKEQVTDFYPYTYYVLTDGESEPLVMQPQYLPNSFTVKGKFALSNTPVERYYPSKYKSDTTGIFYNITNTNCMMLPTATNEGLQFMNANANALAIGNQNQKMNFVLGALTTVGSAMTGNLLGAVGGLGNTISSLQQIKEATARNKDSMLVPSTIQSFGTPSTRNAFDNNHVRVLKFTINNNVKQKVLNFVDRYGNKYNNYATQDIKGYKGYIKYIAPKVESDIDNTYLQEIISILERGVFCE